MNVCCVFVFLQLIHTFLVQDSALVGPRTRLQALTVSITLYARLRLRYHVVEETCSLLSYLFKLVILTCLQYIVLLNTSSSVSCLCLPVLCLPSKKMLFLVTPVSRISVSGFFVRVTQ